MYVNLSPRHFGMGLTDNDTQIVDTTRYDPAIADGSTYQKIVLGAIDKGQDVKGSANMNGSESNKQQAHGQSQTSPRVELGHSAFPQTQYIGNRIGFANTRTNTR